MQPCSDYSEHLRDAGMMRRATASLFRSPWQGRIVTLFFRLAQFIHAQYGLTTERGNGSIGDAVHGQIQGDFKAPQKTPSRPSACEATRRAVLLWHGSRSGGTFSTGNASISPLLEQRPQHIVALGS